MIGFCLVQSQFNRRSIELRKCNPSGHEKSIAKPGSEAKKPCSLGTFVGHSWDIRWDISPHTPIQMSQPPPRQTCHFAAWSRQPLSRPVGFAVGPTLHGEMAKQKLAVARQKRQSDKRRHVALSLLQPSCSHGRIFVLRLQARPGVDAIRVLRGALKVLGRRFGLRAVTVSEEVRRER
jgi:hypothetical protein